MTAFNAFLTKVEAEILTPIITLLGLAAFTVFVWGVVQFIRGADDEEKRKVGTQHMLYGFIGLTIIFGANAIIAVLKSIVGG